MCWKRKNSSPPPDRYRRFEAEKRRIPLNISPREYEEEVKRLARKFKV